MLEDTSLSNAIEKFKEYNANKDKAEKKSTPKVEQVTEESEVEPVKKITKDSFDRFARQDKHVADIRRQLEETKKEFQKDKEELEKFREIEKKLKDDPLATLEQLGLSTNRLNQLFQERSDPRNASERKALAIVEEFKREQREKEEKDAHNKLKNIIHSEIKSKEFDIITDLGMQDSVREYMLSYLDETGEFPKVADACEVIARELYEKVSKTTKSKYYSKFSKPTKEEVVEEEEEEQEVKPVIRERRVSTLSNKLTQSSQQVHKVKTDKDYMDDAIQLMKRINAKKKR